MSDGFDFTCAACGGHVRTTAGTCALCGAPAGSPVARRTLAAPWAATDGAAPAPPAADTAPPSEQDPLLGQVVADRFRVERLVGAGGVGRVYRAWQVGLDRPVALKVLHSEAAATEEQKARFHREARATSRLNHPGCVTVYDFGEWRGQLYIAMEFLEGRSLADVVDAEYPLPPERVVALLGPVCDALAVAHEAGVLHRDLKPENIMVAPRPDGTEQVKLVDFGLAILHEGPQMERLTQEGMIAGTPAYMSPEQCRGKAVEARSDLYALGVILYEMLAGEVPFSAETAVETLVCHLFTPPRPPSEVAPDAHIPPALEQLALAALAKAPGERPPSARDFGARLRAALSDASAAPARGRGDATPLTRQGRADLAGLPRLPASTRLERPTLPKLPPILTLPPPEVPSVNLDALLSVNDLGAARAASVAEIEPLLAQRPHTALVVDLGARAADAALAFGRLLPALGTDALQSLPVVLIGPEEDLALMQQALAAGVAHYVPSSVAADRLPRILRRLGKRALRAARDKGPPGPAPAH